MTVTPLLTIARSTSFAVVGSQAAVGSSNNNTTPGLSRSDPHSPLHNPLPPLYFVGILPLTAAEHSRWLLAVARHLIRRTSRERMDGG